jgi:hypothetical protein
LKPCKKTVDFQTVDTSNHKITRTQSFLNREQNNQKITRTAGMNRASCTSKLTGLKVLHQKCAIGNVIQLKRMIPNRKLQLADLVTKSLPQFLFKKCCGPWLGYTSNRGMLGYTHHHHRLVVVIVKASF